MLDHFRLETDRLLLRRFTMDDAAEYHEIVRHEAVVRNVNSTTKNMEEVREALTALMEKYKRKITVQAEKFSVAVVWKENNRVIGWCGLAPMLVDPADVELYYGLHPDYWNQGIATEAAAAMLRFGFEELKLPRIVGITLPHNKPSARVLEKIGLIYRWTIHDLPKELNYFEGCSYFSLSKNDYIQNNSR
ncbi:GNAT family N-acetyltransferase [bacterium]|nr:GNAT family N-acetyltransferase [bacterium]